MQMESERLMGADKHYSRLSTLEDGRRTIKSISFS